jgi:hypothetical protein
VFDAPSSKCTSTPGSVSRTDTSLRLAARAMPSSPTPAPSSSTRRGLSLPRRRSNPSIPRRASPWSHSLSSKRNETGQTFMPVRSAGSGPVRGCGTPVSKKCCRTWTEESPTFKVRTAAARQPAGSLDAQSRRRHWARIALVFIAIDHCQS